MLGRWESGKRWIHRLKHTVGTNNLHIDDCCWLMIIWYTVIELVLSAVAFFSMLFRFLATLAQVRDAINTVKLAWQWLRGKSVACRHAPQIHLTLSRRLLSSGVMHGFRLMVVRAWTSWLL